MMDPRQRMLLETGWQALEDAAIDPGGLRGSIHNFLRARHSTATP